MKVLFCLSDQIKLVHRLSYHSPLLRRQVLAPPGRNSCYDQKHHVKNSSVQLVKETRAPILPQLNGVALSQNNSFDVSMAWNGAAWSIFNKFDELEQPALSLKVEDCPFEEFSIPNATFRSGKKSESPYCRPVGC